jgi:hypothetical protein
VVDFDTPALNITIDGSYEAGSNSNGATLLKIKTTNETI